jgi:uncharacterized membrane protein
VSFMAASLIPSPSLPAGRIQSVDALRGAIMMLMAIDHIRDYVAQSAQQFLPTDLTRTTPAIFFTRWITHFCAPVFIFSAGLGAYFWMTRGRHSKSELSRLLITRGFWLIILELTILRFVLLSQISFTANPVILMILWAIGTSMIVLAALIYLPMRVMAAISIAIIALHNLLDSVPAERFGRVAWIWDILHQQGAIPFHGITFAVAYPILPWIGVMAGGYCLGTVFEWDAQRRRRFLVRLGLALAVLFVVVRAINIYGDPAPWSHQVSPVFTLLSFLNVTKYPPSLDFLLMTLGPALAVMAWLEKFKFASTNPLIVFGRVPFLYYGLHLLLAHLMEIGLNLARYGAKPFLLLAPPAMGNPSELFPADFGFPLWAVYAVWIAVLVILYPVCLWFGRLKQRRHDWWLTYL